MDVEITEPDPMVPPHGIGAIEKGVAFVTKTTLLGHPLHAIVVAMPLGGLTFSCAMDWLFARSRAEKWRHAADASYAFGCGGMLLSAVTGLGDYLAVPSRTPAKRTANAHAILNVGALVLYAFGLRMRRHEALSPVSTALLSTAGVAAISLAGWYGGHLVYGHRVRVGEGATQHGRVLQMPGDARLSRKLEKLPDRFAPDFGPTL